MSMARRVKGETQYNDSMHLCLKSWLKLLLWLTDLVTYITQSSQLM